MRTIGHLPRLEPIFSYIVEHKGEYGYAPTLREIGEHMGDEYGPMSTSMVTFYLRRLERAGKIKRTRRAARSIVVMEEVEA